MLWGMLSALHLFSAPENGHASCFIKFPHASVCTSCLCFSYPIVTNVAFEVFSCFEFANGRAWLVADVAIECYTAEHRRAKALAYSAICFYPVGLWLLNAFLLHRARSAIRSRRRTRLSKAISFLHREYQVDSGQNIALVILVTRTLFHI